MENIVYFKYSNDRSKKFNIKTSITINENNQKIVYKEPLTDEAVTHIKNIYRYYELLSENYAETNICINRCRNIKDKLQLEYLEGTTLEEILDELYNEKDYLMIIEKIQEYVSAVCNVKKKGVFKLTEGFKKVFGEVNLPNGLEATHISNIDLIFGNIIVTDKWNVIDYEWTFEFPIPFTFIIYRAIYYYVHGSTKRSELISLNLYKLMGISDEELLEYEKMERHFQNYILDQEVPLWKMYDVMGQKRIDVKEVINYEAFNDFQNIVQVFYDRGEGYNEDDSYFIYISNTDSEKVKVKIPVEENVKSVRVDPANNNCIVTVDKAMRLGKVYAYVNYYTNGENINDNTILFTTMDPQIIIRDIMSDTNILEIEFEIENISEEVAKEISCLLGEKKKFIEQIDKLRCDNSRITEQEAKITEQEAKIIEQEAKIIEQELILNENKIVIKKYVDEIKKLNLCAENQKDYIKEVHSTKVWKIYTWYEKLLRKHPK